MMQMVIIQIRGSQLFLVVTPLDSVLWHSSLQIKDIYYY